LRIKEQETRPTLQEHHDDDDDEVMFINKKQLLVSNNLSLEIVKKLIKSCIWSFSVCGSETWTVGKSDERVVNEFETWCRRGMLKIEWTDRITNDEVIQRAKGERLLLKIKKKKWTSLVDRAYS